MNDINKLYKEVETALPHFDFDNLRIDHVFLDHVRNGYKCGKNLERTAAAMGLSLTYFINRLHDSVIKGGAK